MVRVAIPTNAVDTEARLVCAALRMGGDVCDLFYTDGAPLQSSRTIRFSEDEISIFFGREEEQRTWNYQACWLRDLYAPAFDVTMAHPDDRAFVAKTKSRFFYSEWALISQLNRGTSNTFWVNPLSSARLAESKPLQLHLARKAGFEVPDTIISDCPSDIRHFIKSHARVIRKSLIPFQWLENGDFVSNKTTNITEFDDVTDTTFALHPEIYQCEVQKRFEVRVVFFGATYFALQIDPGAKLAAKTVDWRIFHHAALADHCLIRLPDKVLTSCQVLLHDLGLVSGSFDLLVDEKGQYHFMELNQGGLFLWMGVSNVPVFDVFLTFLREGNPNFIWNGRSSDSISVEKVKCSREFVELTGLVTPGRVAAATGVSS